MSVLGTGAACCGKGEACAVKCGPEPTSVELPEPETTYYEDEEVEE